MEAIMKGYRFARCAGLSLVCVLVMATGAFAADNLAATWKQNMAKSKYSPGPPPKSGLSKFEAVEGGIKLTTNGVDAAGKATRIEYTAMYDGKDYPVTGNPDQDTVAYKKIDDYTYENVAKKAGKVTTTTRMVISHDGKMRTNTVTGTDVHGRKVNNTVVFDRQ